MGRLTKDVFLKCGSRVQTPAGTIPRLSILGTEERGRVSVDHAEPARRHGSAAFLVDG